MITEILNFTTSKRVEQIYLEKYIRYETVDVNTHLHNQNVEDYIISLKDKFSVETDDLILLVVKYEPPEKKPNNLDDDWWETWKETCKNLWGFKILNPKLFKRKVYE
jgi:hypothetical protein